MAEEIQGNNPPPGETDLDQAAKGWEKELTLESGEELPTDEDNQLTQEEPDEEELETGSEEDEAEEYDTDEEEEPEEEIYEVKSDGKTHQVTLQDLKDSFSKGQNYTRKSQTLAEEVKEFEREKTETRQVREQLIQALESVRQEPLQNMSEKTDEYWTDLKKTDQLRYLVEREEFNQALRVDAQRDRDLQKLKADQEADRQQELEKIVEGEKNKLLERIPEWNDSKLADKEKKLVIKFGLKEGFTQQELDTAYDSRAVSTMRKAALWDQLQEKKKGIKPVKRQSMKPGSKSGDPTKIKSGKAMERLRKSGSIDDAAAVFYNHIRS